MGRAADRGQRAGSPAQTLQQVLQKAGNKQSECGWDTNGEFRLERSRPLAGASGSHPNRSKKVERAKCWLKRFANAKIPERADKMFHWLWELASKKKKKQTKSICNFCEKDCVEDFAILYSSPEMQTLAGMLSSAVTCPQVVRDKTEKSRHVGKIEGPFNNGSLERKRVSPVGIVPKKAPGKFRLVHYLSHPEGESVNDYTDSLLTLVSRVFSPRAVLSSTQTPLTTIRNTEGICSSAAHSYLLRFLWKLASHIFGS